MPKKGSLNWPKLPVFQDGTLVADALSEDPSDPKSTQKLCQRMSLILERIESLRCEGRLLPVDIFDRLDAWESDFAQEKLVEHSEVLKLAAEFEAYYDFGGIRQINIENWGIGDLSH